MLEHRSEADASPEPLRYDFDIHLGGRSVHTDVLTLVGESRRVLELGPATGYMTRVMRDRGCSVVGIELDLQMGREAEPYCDRVIIGDLEALDLQAELGDDRFDVIVAADVLEHLRDPLAVLLTLREFLAPQGRFVVSLPNVAHGSVRFALLEGRFEYQKAGLLDGTHLRFFTRQSVQDLFDDAELAITRLERHELDLEASEVVYDPSAIPEDVREMVHADPEARTYQFVIEAVPLAQPGMRELQRHLSAQADALAAAEAHVRELQADAARQAERARAEREAAQTRTRELEEAVARLTSREGTVRAALVEAHDRLLERDEALVRLEAEAASLRGRADQVDDLSARLAAAVEEARRLRVRLDRILQSPPLRAYHRLETVPVLRRVANRRQASYNAALERSRQDPGH